MLVLFTVAILAQEDTLLDMQRLAHTFVSTNTKRSLNIEFHLYPSVNDSGSNSGDERPYVCPRNLMIVLTLKPTQDGWKFSLVVFEYFGEISEVDDDYAPVNPVCDGKVVLRRSIRFVCCRKHVEPEWLTGIALKPLDEGDDEMDQYRQLVKAMIKLFEKKNNLSICDLDKEAENLVHNDAKFLIEKAKKLCWKKHRTLLEEAS